MKIALKKTKMNWIKFGDSIEFLIDYPTREQEYKLKEIVYSTLRNLKETAEMSDEELGKSIMLNQKRLEYYLKFTIKDWKGISDEEGNDLSCKLVNNELENILWDSWMKNIDFTELRNIHDLIFSELEFNELDKKKLNS
jgi:hypothetical protein